jgi:hypothetical protein
MSPFSEPIYRGHNLACSSKNQDRLDRKMRKLRTKVGAGSDDVVSPFPQEPKGICTVDTVD